jgi:hypothetical protein
VKIAAQLLAIKSTPRPSFFISPSLASRRTYMRQSQLQLTHGQQSVLASLRLHQLRAWMFLASFISSRS